MTAEAAPVTGPRQPGALSTFATTVAAVMRKELRWRMRGRRAFVVLTVSTLVLSLIVFGIYQVSLEQFASEARWFLASADVGPTGFISGASSAAIGRLLYGGLLGVLTALTLLLAPALASGAISTEREKQTLELLVTTPVSTLGMLLAKLLAALAYVVLLLLASVPLMGAVFVFGGVAPDDVLRAYLLLLPMAFGMGAIGLFMSALIGRTQIATVLAYLVVLLLTLGTLALHTYLLATNTPPDRQFFDEPRHAPEALLWLNPLVADVDLICTAMPETGGPCSYIELVRELPQDGAVPPHDAFWPRSAIAFLVLGCVLTLVSTQLVSPTRRMRSGRQPVTIVPDAPGGASG